MSVRDLRPFVLPAAWLMGVAVIVWTARWPHPRYDEPQPYPVYGVVFVVVFMTLQVALLTWILRPRTYSRSWSRAIFAVLLAFLFSVYALLGTMHAPHYFIFYIYWTLVLLLGLLMLTVWSTIAHLRQSASSR